MSDDIELLVNDARKSFDLGETLKGRPAAQKTVTVRLYLDTETGEQLGGVNIEKNALGKEVRSTWGLLGDVDLLQEEKRLLEAVIEKADELGQTNENTETYHARVAEIDKEIARLKRKIAPLTKKLDETALEVEIRYLPPIIVKAARKDAREHLGIKKVNEENAEDYLIEFAAQVLSRAGVSITKLETGEKNEGISVEDARSLYGFLPDSEVARLDDFVDKVVFRSKIAQKLSLDADF